MKKFLLPENAKYYKANLHSHTVLSDGMKTPEENKAYYKSLGYSIVAFTDHDIYCQQQDLTDVDFVALNGFELEYFEDDAWDNGKCAHFCYIAKDPDNAAFGYNEKKCFDWEASKIPHEPVIGGLYTNNCKARRYDTEFINADIAKGRELGFFISYNHPTWSMERYPDYIRYKGLDTMEIFNHDAAYPRTIGVADDSRVYDDFLYSGQRIKCIATDDNHNFVPDELIGSDSGGGFIQIAPDKLDYASVIKALEEGNYYACAVSDPKKCDAPEIKNLWIEDGSLHVETSNAARIMVIKDKRPVLFKYSERDEYITEAVLQLGEYEWFRVVVTDEYGNKAFSSAYFADEI